MNTTSKKPDRRFSVQDLTIFVGLLSIALGMLGTGWYQVGSGAEALDRLTNPVTVAGVLLLGGLMGAAIAMAVAGRRRAFHGLIAGLLCAAAFLFMASALGLNLPGTGPGDRLE